MTKTIGIVLFPDFEDLDAIGPKEVLTMFAKYRRRRLASRPHLGGRRAGHVVPRHPLHGRPQLRELPAAGRHPDPRRPGHAQGDGQPEAHRLRAERRARDAEYVTSVCTGALVLHKAGFLDGKRATTHWGAIAELKALGGDTTVVDDERWVHDGNVITAAGVSAGIDMALYLVSLLKDAGDGAARAADDGVLPEAARLRRGDGVTFSIVARDPQNGWLGVATASKALASAAAWLEHQAGRWRHREPVVREPVPGDRRAAAAGGRTARGARDRARDRKRSGPRPATDRHRRPGGARRPPTPVSAAFRGPGTSLGGGYVCLGNILAGEQVVKAMADAYERSDRRTAVRAPDAGAGSRAGGGRRPSRDDSRPGSR